jgi:glutaminase
LAAWSAGRSSSPTGVTDAVTGPENEGAASPVIPQGLPVHPRLAELWEHHRADRSGEPAPPGSSGQAAALADPDAFGIAVVTTDGTVHEIGDTRVGFALGEMADPLGALVAGADPAVVTLTAVDLAVMAATLANGGTSPLDGQQVVDGAAVAAALGAMHTGAMYGRSGEWMYRSGLPARSSRSGGVVAVLAGQAGVGVYSPRLDAAGRSVRGMRVCEELSREGGIRLGGDQVGSHWSGAGHRVIAGTVAGGSRRVHNLAEQRRLDEVAAGVRVVEVDGELDGQAADALVGALLAMDDGVTHVLVDLEWVTGADTEGPSRLEELVDRGRERGISVAFCGSRGLRLLEGALPEGVPRHTDRHLALASIEDHLLGGDPGKRLDLAQFDLCHGMDDEDIAALGELCGVHWFPPGALVCEPDSPDADAYLIRRGRAEVLSRSGEQLAVHGPGTTVGELALLTEQPRSAAVRAETELDCYTLSPQGLRAFTARRPHGAARLLANMARVLAERLRATTEARARR